MLHKVINSVSAKMPYAEPILTAKICPNHREPARDFVGICAAAAKRQVVELDVAPIESSIGKNCKRKLSNGLITLDAAKSACLAAVNGHCNGGEKLSSERFLSDRGLKMQKLEASLNFLGFYRKKCNENSFNAITNPQGFINLGTAENYLIKEMITAKFSEPGFMEYSADMNHYFKWHGVDSLRSAAAQFINKYFSCSGLVEANDLVFANGTGSLLDMLAFLTANPEEVFLCPAPYYTCIKQDMYERAQVHTFDIPLASKSELSLKSPASYAITVESVQSAFASARSKGLVVKGIVLINPGNPVGIHYAKDAFLPILQFAKEHELYVVVDEIYALTTFDQLDTRPFQSVLSYWSDIPDPDRTVWVWGLSKDFGIPGLRSSFAFMRNPVLLETMQMLAEYQSVPVVAQKMVEKLLLDFDWLDNYYLPKTRQMMKAHFGFLSRELEKLGARVVPATSAFFVWAYFGDIMKETTFANERKLFDAFFAQGVYAVPGKELFSPEPGWFRFIFTADKAVLEVALTRIKEALSHFHS